GERKGVNKYYPPDFDPAKHGSLNGYWKSHPLRERARKLSQGILIIRFEMPYNIWCDGCKNHIGMGVRYNAEKKKVGNYYTTPIYRFRMKCHLCVNYIEMQTDPATCDYVIVSGASRKEERWDMADNEQILTTESSEKEKLETDPMYKLDHGGKDKEKLHAALPTLSELQGRQERWKDDFLLNCTLRRKFRDEKKAIAVKEQKDDEVRKRTGLSIPLVPEKEEDKRLASLLTFQTTYEERQRSKRREILNRSWFCSSQPQAGTSGTLLQKLAQAHRGAALTAAAKGPYAVTPNSLLGVIRRKTDSAKLLGTAMEACKTSDPEAFFSNNIEESGDPEILEECSAQLGMTAASTVINSEMKASMSHMCTETDTPDTDASAANGAVILSGGSEIPEDGENGSHAILSLVADY
ncbi:coiled-coil domain-containing protein 130-like, partial [Scleropages formosus]